MMDSGIVGEKRILLVDDQPEVRQSIKMLLDLDGHLVIEAGDGPEALARFDLDRFDLVITDYAMPGMCGDEVARRMKQKVPTQPVLLITGSAGVSLATAKPVDAILYKPFLLEDLRHSVAGLLAAKPI